MAKKSGKEPTPAEIRRVMKHLSDLGAAKGGKAGGAADGQAPAGDRPEGGAGAVGEGARGGVSPDS